MDHLFKVRENNFNLRELVTHNKETSNYGLETAFTERRFFKLPSEYKNSTS